VTLLRTSSGESRRVLRVVAWEFQEGLIMPMNVPTVDETHGHDHFHGTLDPALLTSEKGIWAVNGRWWE
jgi:hypothetical protein